MERICRECGSLVSGNARFCPACGTEMERAVDLGKHGDDNPAPNGIIVNVPTGNSVGPVSGYGAPQYGQQGIPQIVNNTQNNNTGYEFMSTGEWFLTISVGTFFGIVSLILNIVWGFGATTPEPRRSFCRAMFYVNLISGFLGIILAGVIIGIATS